MVMSFPAQQGTIFVWSSLGVLWLVGAFTTKRTTRAQSSASTIMHLALMTLAFNLLFNHKVAYWPLALRFLPDGRAVEYSGLALTVVGAAFAACARLWIGSNWSAVVTIKQQHQLIQSGPYAIVRHPIYSGFLLAMVGTAIAFGEVRGLVAVAVAFFGWYQKIRLEEAFMSEQFGEEYLSYKRRVKALIPFLA
jgi:protein-S-isoprenylcysteine O-methyltransferase Ste14